MNHFSDTSTTMIPSSGGTTMITVDYYEMMKFSHWNPKFHEMAQKLAALLLQHGHARTALPADLWSSAELIHLDNSLNSNQDSLQTPTLKMPSKSHELLLSMGVHPAKFKSSVFQDKMRSEADTSRNEVVTTVFTKNSSTENLFTWIKHKLNPGLGTTPLYGYRLDATPAVKHVPQSLPPLQTLPLTIQSQGVPLLNSPHFRFAFTSQPDPLRPVLTVLQVPTCPVGDASVQSVIDSLHPSTPITDWSLGLSTNVPMLPPQIPNLLTTTILNSQHLLSLLLGNNMLLKPTILPEFTQVSNLHALPPYSAPHSICQPISLGCLGNFNVGPFDPISSLPYPLSILHISKSSDGRLDVLLVRDEAKTRFMCSPCSRQWTSMKGSITFVVVMSHWLGGPIQLSEWTVQPGANVFFELFPQSCGDCDLLCQPKWYPEEIFKVIRNLFVRIHDQFYGDMIPWDDQWNWQRRDGQPSGPHDSQKCVACQNGFCRGLFRGQSHSVCSERNNLKVPGTQTQNSNAHADKSIPERPIDRSSRAISPNEPPRCKRRTTVREPSRTEI
ncbi:hypothetical protein EG68_02314 [Paragonimus skrjabini miyazakii]|uniref:3CxxC-type domain-containing protein n=1 Tax=Paragonimus skrjabini miyazakii TaxID=59628 RepID=A0A8S9Z2A0_9TREM|nr:hypothetical protein EG68_02314 [Paragonimus skrjabini miyazakii]